MCKVDVKKYGMWKNDIRSRMGSKKNKISTVAWNRLEKNGSLRRSNDDKWVGEKFAFDETKMDTQK